MKFKWEFGDIEKFEDHDIVHWEILSESGRLYGSCVITNPIEKYSKRDLQKRVEESLGKSTINRLKTTLKETANG